MSCDVRFFFTVHGHTELVGCVTWSPDGRRLVTASDDGRVKLWDGSNGDGILSLGTFNVNSRRIRFSPDGGRLMAVSQDVDGGAIYYWDGTPAEKP